MSDRGAVRLVAGREIAVRLRERAFQGATLLSVIIVIAIVALAAALDGDDTSTISVVRGDGDSARVAALARESLGRTGAPAELRRADSLSDARAEVRDGDTDVAVVGSGAQVLVRDGLDDAVAQALQAAVTARALEAQAGGDRVRRIVADPPQLTVRRLDPDDSGAAGVAFVAALLLYGQLITFGLWVANGIAEEKGSRVIELLLSATRPLALLAGKVAGIGLLGFGQLLLVGAVGLGAGVALDVIAFDGGVAGALAATLGFFVLGYAVYAALFAVVGSLVSRQEDVQSTASPLVLVLVGAFFVAVQALQSPTSALADVAALVPFTAPLVMPARLITGDAGLADAILATALLIATAIAVLTLAARVYTRTILRTGARVPLREAF